MRSSSHRAFCRELWKTRRAFLSDGTRFHFYAEFKRRYCLYKGRTYKHAKIWDQKIVFHDITKFDVVGNYAGTVWWAHVPASTIDSNDTFIVLPNKKRLVYMWDFERQAKGLHRFESFYKSQVGRSGLCNIFSQSLFPNTWALFHFYCQPNSIFAKGP